MSELLVFTYADRDYYMFVIPFIFFCHYSNPGSKIEIIIDDLKEFKVAYAKQIKIISDMEIDFTLVQSDWENRNIMANSIRFIQKPQNTAKYIYITDIDIFILADVLALHLPMMARYNMFYSNRIRPENNKKLTGLHFIEYDAYYPLELQGLDLGMNDEELLYAIMFRKYPDKINESYTYRPSPGVHLSLNRPPVSYKSFPGLCSWEFKNYCQKFIDIQQSDLYKLLFHTFDIEIRHLLLILEYFIIGKSGQLSLYSLHYGIDRDNIFAISEAKNCNISEAYAKKIGLLALDPFRNFPDYLLFLIKNGNYSLAHGLAKNLIDMNKQKFCRSRLINDLLEDTEANSDDDSDVCSTFKNIYKTNAWRGEESRSGPGSSLKNTKDICENLPMLFAKYKISSIIDAACGDMNWMKTILPLLNCSYLGIDIVDELIENNKQEISLQNCSFMCGDIRSLPLPTVDLVLVRDCLMHFSYRSIRQFFHNFIQSNCKYLLAGAHINNGFLNKDIPTGSWRMIDLLIPPFSFPQPMAILKDGSLKQLYLFSRKQIAQAKFIE